MYTTSRGTLLLLATALSPCALPRDVATQTLLRVILFVPLRHFITWLSLVFVATPFNPRPELQFKLDLFNRCLMLR